MKIQLSDSRILLVLGVILTTRTLFADQSTTIRLNPGPSPVNVLAFEFTPDGKQLVTSRGDCIQLWSASDGKMFKQLDRPLGSLIRDFAIAPNGKQLVLSLYTYKDQNMKQKIRANKTKTTDKICLYDLATLTLAREIPLDKCDASSVQYSPDGSTIFAGCYVYARDADYIAIKTFDPATGVLTKDIRTDGTLLLNPKYLAVSPNGKIIAAFNNPGMLQLWRNNESNPFCELLTSLSRHPSPDQSSYPRIFFSRDGKYLATFLDEQDMIEVWSVDKLVADPQKWRNAHMTSIQTYGPVRSAAFSPDGQWIAVADGLQGAVMLTLPLGERVVELGFSDAKSVVFSQDGNRLALESKGEISIIDMTPYKDSDNVKKLSVKKLSTPSDPELRKRFFSLMPRRKYRTVSLTFNKEDWHFVVDLLTSFERINELQLQPGGELRKISDEQVAELAKLPHLQSLTINGLIIPSFNSLSRLPHLQSLSFLGNAEVEDWNAMPQMTGIKKLQLNGVGFDSSSGRPISYNLFTTDDLSFISRLTTLEELEISGSNITPASAELLRDLKMLRSLDISSTEIHDACHSLLADLQALETVRLGRISPKSLELLAALPKLKNLEFDGSELNLQDLRLISSSSSIRALTIHGVWLPGLSLVFVRNLPDMRQDELEAYELINLLAQIARRYKEQSSVKDLAGYYLGLRKNRRVALDIYAEISDAKISLEEMMTLCESKARSAVQKAFKGAPRKVRRFNAEIDALRPKRLDPATGVLK